MQEGLLGCMLPLSPDSPTVNFPLRSSLSDWLLIVELRAVNSLARPSLPIARCLRNGDLIPGLIFTLAARGVISLLFPKAVALPGLSLQARQAGDGKKVSD